MGAHTYKSERSENVVVIVVVLLNAFCSLWL